MNPREFLAKRKIHLIFVSGLVLVLALNITLGFTPGQTFQGAIWRAVSEIKPMEYVLFALFWYAFAAHPPKDDWDSSLIALNLSRSNNLPS